MIKKIVCFLFIFLSSVISAQSSEIYVEVIATQSIIGANEFPESKALYNTRKGNRFLYLSERENVVNIQVVGKQVGWIPKQDVKRIESEPLQKTVTPAVLEAIESKKKRKMNLPIWRPRKLSISKTIY